MSHETDEPEPGEQGAGFRGGPWFPLAVALLGGLGLFGLSIVTRSLWIDEFHALHHASARSLADCLASVQTDNHPPLAFLLTRGTRAHFGDGAPALRCWSVAVGLLTILVAWRFGRRLPEGPARPAAALLVGISSYSMMIFSEVRMYGLLALSVLGLMSAIADTLEGRKRRAWIVFWVAVGMHSHYYFVHYGAVLALVLSVGAVVQRRWRPGVFQLVLPALIGLALFLPWGWTGFRAQLSHEMPSGGSSGLYANWMGFCQSLAHFLFMNTSVGGDFVTYGLALPGSLAGAVLGVLGLVRLWKARGEDHGLTLLLLVSVGILVPAWALAFSELMPRAGYNWRYISGSCVPILMVVACGMGSAPGWRRLLGGVLVTTCGGASLWIAFTPGQEDYHGAISHILQNARPGDAVVTRPMRTVHVDTAPTGWPYYLRHGDRPATLGPGDEPVEYRLPYFHGALEHERVWLYIRYRFPAEALALIESRYAEHEVVEIGPVLTVHLFSGRIRD